MFCGSCGKEIDDNAKFCPYCSMSVSDNSSSQKKKNTINIVFSILGFLFAPIGLILYLIYNKSKPQIASALFSGARLFMMIVFFIAGVIFLIDGFGRENPILIFFNCFWVLFCGYLLLGFLLQCLLPDNILPEIFKKSTPVKIPTLKKPDTENEQIVVVEPTPNVNTLNKSNKKRGVYWVIAIFILLTVVPSIISGYISFNSPAGKYYVKYDNNGNKEFTITFPNFPNISIREHKIIIEYHSGNYSRGVLGQTYDVDYEFYIRTKQGKLIFNDRYYKYVDIIFTVSNNILILSAGKASGDIILPHSWDYGNGAGGIYIERK